MKKLYKRINDYGIWVLKGMLLGYKLVEEGDYYYLIVGNFTSILKNKDVLQLIKNGFLIRDKTNSLVLSQEAKELAGFWLLVCDIKVKDKDGFEANA